MEWDDIKYLIAVADQGSIEVAARALKVGPPIVERHIESLESSLNCELLLRTADGVKLSASGERAVKIGREVAMRLDALAKELGGEHGELTGQVSVTSTATFVPRAMTALDPLRVRYPALRVEVVVSSHVVDLHRKEADIAVRMFRDDKEGLAMRRLGSMGWSLYASQKYLDGHTRGPNLLDGHKVIAYDGMMIKTSGGRWLATNATDDKIVLRVGGFRQALEAAEAHKGVCIVPCYLAQEHKVVRVTPDVLATNEVFAVYLAERSEEARLRIVTDSLADLFVREENLFAGV